MKIPVQDKIAELERRIVALESLVGTKEQWQRVATEAKATRATVTRTKTTTTAPLTPEQHSAMDSMWQLFDETFVSMRKVFK